MTRAFLSRISVAATAAVALLAVASCERPAPPAADFEDQGFAACPLPEEGCPCAPGHVVACYPSSAFVDQESGEEYCLEGVRRCGPDGTWGGCTFPEGTKRSAIIGDPELCGGCDPACFKVHDCPTQRDLSDENANNVRYDLDADGIVLGGEIVNARYAYIANYAQNTVSKIDLSTRIEVGRYRQGMDNPSRTAIDGNGDAYVANRDDGTVTKIAGPIEHCVDRDGDTVLETSHGSAFLATDECVLWTSRVNWATNNPGLRALAVDRLGRIWVGGLNRTYVGGVRGYYFWVLDPSDGSVIRSVPIPRGAYGAAIDSGGVLWYSSRDPSTRYIGSVDTTTLATGEYYNSVCGDHYGMAIDLSDRIWVACAYTSSPYSAPHLGRFTPSTGAWDGFASNIGNRCARGVTIDAEGDIWVGVHDSRDWSVGQGYAYWYDADTGAPRATVRLEGCRGAIGIGADFDGYMWVSCAESQGAARLDPDTGVVDITTLGVVNYTYSDFTGFLRATVTAPEGSYTRRYDSRLTCEPGWQTFWSQLYYTTVTPPGTRIRFFGKTVDVVTDFGLAPEMLLAEVNAGEDCTTTRCVASVQEIMDASGVSNGQRFFETRVFLQSVDSGVSPIFRDMHMVYYCVCQCDVSASCDAGCTCDDDC